MTEENEQANIAAPTAKPARVERPARLPRLFLWLVAIAIILVIVAAFAWRLAGNRLLSRRWCRAARLKPPQPARPMIMVILPVGRRGRAA